MVQLDINEAHMTEGLRMYTGFSKPGLGTNCCTPSV